MTSATVSAGDTTVTGRPGVASGRTRWLAWSLMGVVLVLALIAEAMFISSASTPIPPRFGFRGAAGVGALMYAGAGLVLVLNRSRNPIGWILLLLGVDVATQAVVDEYAIRAMFTDPGGLPGGIYAVWVYGWIYYPIPVALLLLLLLFPDGKLPSKALIWKALAWSTVVWALGGVLVQATVHGPIPDYEPLENPFGLLPASTYTAAIAVLTIMAFASMAGAIWGTVGRYRRGSLILRQQVRWVVLATSLAVLALIANGVNWAFDATLVDPTVRAIHKLTSSAFVIFLFLIPVAVVIAVMRYRLYEIDVIFRRTLVYGPVTAVLAGVFAATMGVTQKVFVVVTGQRSDAAAVITTLTIVAIFTPVRSLVQSTVDRKFKHVEVPRKEIVDFAGHVSSIAQVLDRNQLAEVFLEKAIFAFGASGGTVSLKGQDGQQTLISRGETSGRPGLSAKIEWVDVEFGSVVLMVPEDARNFTEQDHAALRSAASAVGRAFRATLRP